MNKRTVSESANMYVPAGLRDLPHSYDFSFDWIVNRHAEVYERRPDGLGCADILARFEPEQQLAIRNLVSRHNRDVQFLLAEIDELKNGPRLGWSYVGDGGSEWSDSHPIESGEQPDAEDIQPCTLKRFWEAK